MDDLIAFAKSHPTHAAVIAVALAACVTAISSCARDALIEESRAHAAVLKAKLEANR